MSAIVPGGLYELLPVPGSVRTVDGTVTVIEVGPIGPTEWATVSGRVEVPVEDLEDGEVPGLVEEQTWITLASRIGEPVRQAVAR
ncbi:hypothetical protein [Streptomyces sp. RPT161]|uniref:hypothetical protein n=1 Tax=Streptomyces sp. RPT161 TaxID=3015993 RepID=UPI0022B8D7EB|nr:hypothetical protein [Streptomyces sp. RPT161]